MSSGFSLFSNKRCRIKKIGKLVLWDVEISGNLTANSLTVVATFPAELRPSSIVHGSFIGVRNVDGAAVSLIFASLTTDGKVNVNSNAALSSNTQFISGKLIWLADAQ